MIRWRPPARKFAVRLVVRRLSSAPAGRMAAEVTWKGPRGALGRRTVRRNRTRDEDSNGGIEWEEEFGSVCGISAHPWVVEFAVLNVSNQRAKYNDSVVGVASLNLADFVSRAAEEDIEIVIPLSVPGVAAEFHPSLHLTLSLVELRTSQEASETTQRSIVPVALSPPAGNSITSEKDDFSVLKSGLRKVKLFKDFVSTRKAKKTSRGDESSEGRSSDRSEDAESPYPFDTDSLDGDPNEGEIGDGKGDSFRKSFSYGTLPLANYIGGSFFANLVIDGEYEDWVYYSHRRSDVGCSRDEEARSSEQSPLHTPKKSILPWNKRKLSFRSPKARGEPLLKKAYAEDGGDDIDFDRRQLSSSDESLYNGNNNLASTQLPVSEFGDDNFAIGSWESKELVSRDGRMKLSTKVFFASIDQRSERASGESACTALVAVIADWFQSNRDSMPIKSQFDSLIRDGSLEWRDLCENQTYRNRFPDKHFDLETVLEAGIRPLSVVPDKSFVGFFRPEIGIGGFDFLHGAMSFDSIWDEISQSEHSNGLFIVSWNDHFFVLKVESDAYYIIDTLGERLHEGCNQAYILRFDDNTAIHRMPEKDIKKEGDAAIEGEEQQLVCRGKESCKEYIKGFLAAIPINELEVDIKKGLMASTILHHRLQIEFHYTSSIETQASQPAISEAVFCPSPAMKLEVMVV